MPHIGAYLYPWDAERLGIGTTLDDLVRHGITSIDLTTTYHTIASFSPRGASPSVAFLPAGGVMYPSSVPAQLGVVPPPVPYDAQQAWGAIVKGARQRGLTVNAWTVGLYQPWLAQQMPAEARTLATGDILDTGLCPSSSFVRDYLAAVAAEVSTQYPIGQVRLEGIGFPPLDYGWLRARFLSPLSGAGRRALAYCFCSSCRARAHDAGVDVARVSALLIDVILGSAHGANEDELLVQLDEEGVELLDRVRIQAVQSLIRQVAEAISTTSAGLLVCTPSDLNGGITPPLAEIADVLDGVMIRAADRYPTPGEVDSIRAAAGERHLKTVAFVPDWFGSAGSGTPVDERDLEQISRIDLAGIDEIAIYHYGMLTDAAFASVARAARGIIEGVHP